MNNQSSNIKGISILLLTSFIWGVAFTAQSAGAEYLDAFSYTSLRFALGLLLLIPAIFIVEKRASDKVKLKRTFVAGLFCGGIMFIAITLQQYGIQLTSNSGKAGFITCLYILIVPIIGLFMKRFPSVNVWIGVICGVIGMYMLTVKENSAIEVGDILIMISALFWAVHIIVIDKFASDIYALRFSATQFTVVALISAVCMLIFEDLSFEAVKAAWIPLAYGGFCSVGIAYTLQTIGQRYAEPVPASMALSMESVFATLAGAVILKERMEFKCYIGCVLIFTGIILAQLPQKYFELRRIKRSDNN